MLTSRLSRNSRAEQEGNAYKSRPSSGFDVTLLVFVILLAVWGLTAILSASAPVAQSQLRDSLYYFQRQLVWFVLGATVLLVGATIRLSFVRALALHGLAFTAILLVLVQVPGIGVTELGSTRWLRLFGLSIQPSEIAKVTLAVYLADVLARRAEEAWNLVQVRQALIPVAAVLGLVYIQPDLGTTIVLAIAAFVAFFCHGVPLRVMSLTGVAGVIVVMYVSLSTPYQRARWIGFWDPWGDPQHTGYQLVQSLMAIGSGGVLGQGWGQSKQKLFYLPIQYADFIFAIVDEEMGLIGAALLIGMFVLLAWRGFAIAMRARDEFHALLSLILTTSVVGQAFINIGVVTASLPTTGIPLPFLSFGGTSLLTTMFAMGLILNVSRQAQARMIPSVAPPPA